MELFVARPPSPASHSHRFCCEIFVNLGGRFGLFLFFLLRVGGRGKSEALGRGGGGSVFFFIEMPGGGWGPAARVQEGVCGEWGNLEGWGGLSFFISGPEIPPRNVSDSDTRLLGKSTPSVEKNGDIIQSALLQCGCSDICESAERGPSRKVRQREPQLVLLATSLGVPRRVLGGVLLECFQALGLVKGLENFALLGELFRALRASLPKALFRALSGALLRMGPFVSGLQKEPAERGHVKNRQKSSKSVKTNCDIFRQSSRRAKNDRNRQKCQHF